MPDRNPIDRAMLESATIALPRLDRTIKYQEIKRSRSRDSKK
jgi:hypothetical protein